MMTTLSPLEQILSRWQNEPGIAANIVETREIPAREAVFGELFEDIHPGLKRVLESSGITRIYSHQAAAFEAASAGQNVVMSTGTASGKSLGYQLPVLNTLLNDPAARALFLFPTKALGNDQVRSITALLQMLNPISGTVPIHAAAYDGDTPASQRSSIRAQARILLTNPDMLHIGILPHHTNWAEFFRSLRYVVIDEIHIYRGVFGAHLANLVRRLKRVCQFYGAFPTFIMTSATISNPREHAEHLVESPVTLIDQDGSPAGRRFFLIYNPPVIHPDLGLRRSAAAESVRLAQDLWAAKMQTLIFVRSRRAVEILLRDLRDKTNSNDVQGYRSGYLPQERRAIEDGLKHGEVRLAVSTNALELGVDIGGMNAVILVGYPGSIATIRQQAGRAGRRLGDALAVLVASAAPLDQYLARHPEYVLERSPEHALLNADNLVILLQHLRCAAFELSFQEGEKFGAVPMDVLQGLMEFLAADRQVHHSNQRYFWISDQYPANSVSLRTASASPFRLLSTQDPLRMETIGEVDEASANWMVHPGAVYLHAGRSYQVEALDFEQHQARLRPVELDYFTEPIRKTTVQKISTLKEEEVPGGIKGYGELLVTTQVVGYREIQWFTRETLRMVGLEMPATQLRTVGYWVYLNEASLEQLKRSGFWRSDPIQYGPNWERQRQLARQRDRYTCQACGAAEGRSPHHVHHKTPFRMFTSAAEANRLENLITLCPACHRQAEAQVRVRSGLAGLSYLMRQIAPLILMCDLSDIETHVDHESVFSETCPAVVLYDQIPDGIGLSESAYQEHLLLMAQCRDQLVHCGCPDGCPGCVGPSPENGFGGKPETLAMLNQLVPFEDQN